MPLFISRTAAQERGAVPEGLPVFSPGRHRSARTGACFMEYASHLAGEPWSDHPSCTHPAIGRLARLVNDKTSDSERSGLVTLVPSVIGLTTDDREIDRRVELHVALRAATAALPIVTADRRNAMAVTVIRCAQRLAPFGSTVALDDAAQALATVPAATKWARDQLVSTPFRRSVNGAIATADMTVLAVGGIRLTERADADGVLGRLLETAIRECWDLVTSKSAAPNAAALVSR